MIYSFVVSDIGSYRCLVKNFIGMVYSLVMVFMDILKCKCSFV